jgi:hypothetical protein
MFATEIINFKQHEKTDIYFGIAVSSAWLLAEQH